MTTDASETGRPATENERLRVRLQRVIAERNQWREVAEHYEKPAGPRASHPPGPHAPPAPFIVGVPRSGTTLLRLMLDAHSQLAIPPETYFVAGAAELTGAPAELRRSFFETVTKCMTWADFNIPSEKFRDALDPIEPFNVADGLRAFYRLYAGFRDKPRWGDKTPLYLLYQCSISRLLPEAYFIHIIRDGRDVTLSARDKWFAPGADMAAIAQDWCNQVRVARAAGRIMPHYLELQYEKLVREPESELRRICAFVDLPFEPGMLDYAGHARERMAEAHDWFAADGTHLMTREERLNLHRATFQPPDPGRIGQWKTRMTGDERQAFHTEAGSLLSELGYET